MTARALRAPAAMGGALGPVGATLAAGAVAVSAAAAVALGPLALGLPVAVVAGVVLLREPMALLTLYVWVGLYKDQSVVASSPVDVTLLLGLLLIVLCAYRWACGRVKSVPLGLAAPLVAISALLVVSLSWTPSPGYGGDKAVKFVTLTLLATLAPFFLVQNERDVRRYFSWTVVLAMVTAVFTIINPPADDGRLTIGSEGNTIGISHVLCTAALILLVGALTDLIVRRGWAVAGAIGLVAVAAAIGSRGPLLSLAFALLATGAVWLARVPRKLAPVLVAVVAAAAALPFISLPQDSSQRLARAVRDPVTSFRTDPRYDTFSEAVTLIEHHPLVGVGTGGFQSVGTLAVPPEDYPHNMVLEVWAELGLLPLAILLASVVTLLAGLWRGAWRHAHDASGRLLYVLIGFLLFNLFETLLTGDLNENRAFWGVFGLAWLVVQHGVPGSAPPPTERR
jgi:O-antigen ligase